MTIQYAKVTSILSGFPYVTFLGEELESKTKYPKLATYTPTLGDMVAFLVDDKEKYLMIGKVI